jgi:carnosine N-methyltransferase
MSSPNTASEEWAGDFDPLSDDEERRVLFAALDAFR